MKNVNAKVKVIQMDTDENSQTTEFIFDAKLYKKGNTYYISYIESKISDLCGSKTVIKVCDGIINIIRFGTVGSNLKFQEKMEHNVQYETPYGIMPMMMFSKVVDVSIDENYAEIFLDYDIYIDGHLSTKNKFYLSVE